MTIPKEPKKMPTGHPKISIFQQVKGGTWYFKFLDPRTGKQRATTSGSTDYAIAETLAIELNTIVTDADKWASPPPRTSKRLLEIIGTNPVRERVEKAVAELSRLKPIDEGLNKMLTERKGVSGMTLL